MLNGYFVLGGLALLALAVWQRQYFGMLVASGVAQLGKLARGALAADPIAVYQNQVDVAAKEISGATDSLATQQSVVERLTRQVVRNTKDIARLNALAEACVRKGDDARAADYLVQVKKLETEKTDNDSQLQEAKTNYQDEFKKINFARERIEDAKRNAEKLKGKLELSSAKAASAKLASKFNVANTLDGLGQIEEEIMKQVDQNNSLAKVNDDMNASMLYEIELKEEQQRAEAADLLKAMKEKVASKN